MTKITPTEYDMLIDDEQTLLEEMEDCKSILINLEDELQVVRDKLAFIKKAVPENVEISIHS
jgi:DNA gyrase/topoisomerase IV subunit A